MSPESIESFLALAIGFAFAGLISTLYQLLAQRPASFRLLEQDARMASVAAVPFVVFAAPFMIMRNTLRGHAIARRRFQTVMLATVIAGFWSLMSGTCLIMALKALATTVI